MKKTQTIERLSIILFSICLAACGGSSTDTPPDDGPDEEFNNFSSSYAGIDLGTEIVRNLVSNQIEISSETELEFLTLSSDNTSQNLVELVHPLDILPTSYDIDADISPVGSFNVESRWENSLPGDGSTTVGSVLANGDLQLSSPEEIEINTDDGTASIYSENNILLKQYNNHYFASNKTEKRDYGLKNNQPDFDNPLSVEAETRLITLIEKPDSIQASDLDGRTYGFVAGLAAAGESREFNGVLSGISYGKTQFTSQEIINSPLTVSAIEVLPSGELNFLLEYEDDSDSTPRPFTITPDGRIEDEESIGYVSKDRSLLTSIYNNSDQQNPANEGFISNHISVLLDSNTSPDVLNGKSFQLIAHWRYQGGGSGLGSGYIGIVDFSSLTLSINSNGVASLDGEGMDRGIDFPFADPDEQEESLAINDDPFQIISDNSNNHFIGNITVAADGFFSVALTTPAEWGNPLNIRGYVQNGGNFIVGTMTSIIEYDGEKEGMDSVIFVGILEE